MVWGVVGLSAEFTSYCWRCGHGSRAEVRGGSHALMVTRHPSRVEFPNGLVLVHMAETSSTCINSSGC